MKAWFGLLVALAGGLLLAVIGTTPPAPLAATAPEESFSAARAMAHVERMAASPRPTGSGALEEVRGYLAATLRELGAEVSFQAVSLSERGTARLDDWRGEKAPVSAPELVNIIGVFPGAEPDLHAVLLMAHYDSVWGSPGAADDAAGVAAILEVVRALQAEGGDRQRGIIVLLTDAEELDLGGARAFFTEHPLRERAGAIVNLEARGAGGRTTLFQTSSGNGAAVRLYQRAVPRPAGSSLATFVYDQLPNDTDLTEALSGPYTSYNLSFIGRPGLYHSPAATAAALDRGALQDMGAQTLALTRELSRAAALPEPEADWTFFDVFGLFLIAYPAWGGWILFAAAAVLQWLALRGLPKAANLGRRAAGFVAVAGGGGLLLYAGNLLSGADGVTNYYDRLAAIPRLEAQGLLICLAVLVATAPIWAGRLGAPVALVLGLALQIAAPTTSYIVLWPLLLGSLAAAAVRYVKPPLAPLIAAIPAALGLGFLLQFGHALMQAVGPDMPAAAALFAALAVPLLAPLTPQVRRKAGLAVAGACLLVAAGIALWVRLDPVADTVAVYSEFR